MGNLLCIFNSEKLTEMFKTHGRVNSAKVVTDRESGRSEGFGFVEIESDANNSI